MFLRPFQRERKKKRKRNQCYVIFLPQIQVIKTGRWSELVYELSMCVCMCSLHKCPPIKVEGQITVKKMLFISLVNLN